MLQAVLFDLDGTLLDRLSCLRVYLYGQVERLANDLHALPFGEYMERVIELDAHGHADKGELFRRIERDFALARYLAEDAGRFSDLLSPCMRSVSQDTSDAYHTQATRLKDGACHERGR